MKDFETVVEINLRNIMTTLKNYGAILVGAMAFLLSMFLTIGLAFDFELMQAIGLFWFFLCILGAVSWKFLLRLSNEKPKGAALIKAFRKHHIVKQFIGFLALFVTAFYGMLTATFNIF